MQKLILAYHGVGEFRSRESQWIEYGTRRYHIKELSVDSSLFAKHLAYLRAKGYKDISLRDFLAREKKGEELAQRGVAITFDDGFKNLFTFARPLLVKYGYRATIFLVTDKIGQRHFLSWDEACRLREQGFSFGAHTCSHSLLTQLPLNIAKQEIEESKKIIEEKLGMAVEFFCYPYGQFNLEIQGLVQQAGFLGAVVTPTGPGLKESPYSLKRIAVNKNNSMLTFMLKMSRGFTWLREQKLLWRLVRKVKPYQ